MSERSFAGYTLAELEQICMAKASAPMNGDELTRYRNAACAALPFLIARIHQMERRPKSVGKRHQEARQRASG